MDKKRKRSSILKKRPIPDVASPTETTYTRQSRRISFSENKLVKEFMAGEEVATIWGTSYEEQTETMNIAVAEAAAKVRDNVKPLETDNSVMFLRKGKCVVKTPHEANVKKTKRNKNEIILPEHDKENIMVGVLDIFHSNNESKRTEKVIDDSRVLSTANIEVVDMELSVCLDETEKPAPIVATESSTTIAAKPVLQDSLDISLTADEIIQYSKKPNVKEVKEIPSNDNVSVKMDPVPKTSFCSSNTEISINPYSSFSFFEKERKKLKRISKSVNGLIDITLTDIRDFSECSSHSSGQKSRSSSLINPVNIDSIVEEDMQVDYNYIQLNKTSEGGNKTMDIVSNDHHQTQIFDSDYIEKEQFNKQTKSNPMKRKTQIYNDEDIIQDSQYYNTQNASEAKRRTIVFDKIDIESETGEVPVKRNELLTHKQNVRKTQKFESDDIVQDSHNSTPSISGMSRKTIHFNKENIDVENQEIYSETKKMSKKGRDTQIFESDDIVQDSQIHRNTETEEVHVKRNELLTHKQNVRKTQIFESDDIVQDSHNSTPSISGMSRKTIHFNKENIDMENQEIYSETKKISKKGRDTQIFESDDIVQDSQIHRNTETEEVHVKRNELLTHKQNVRKTQIFESDDIVQDSHNSTPSISGMSRKTIHFNKENIDMENQEIYSETKKISKKGRDTQIFESDDIVQDSQIHRNTESEEVHVKRNELLTHKQNVRKTQIFKSDDIVQDSHNSTPSISGMSRKTIHFNKENIDVENQEIYSETKKMSKKGRDTQIFESDDIVQDSQIHRNTVTEEVHVKRNELLTHKQNVRKTQIFESDDIVQDSRNSTPSISGMSRKTIHFNKENIDVENQEIYSETKKIPKKGRDTQIFDSDDITSSFNTNKTSNAGAKRKTTHFDNDNIHEESLRLTEKNQINPHGCDQMDISLMSETSTSHPDFNTKNKINHESKYFVEEKNDSLNLDARKSHQTVFYNKDIAEDESIDFDIKEKSYKQFKDKRQTIYDPVNIEIEENYCLQSRNQQIYNKINETSKNHRKTSISETKDITPDSVNNNPSTSDVKRKTTYFLDASLDIDPECAPSSAIIFNKNKINTKEDDFMDLSLSPILHTNIEQSNNTIDNIKQNKSSQTTIYKNSNIEVENYNLISHEKSYRSLNDKRPTIHKPIDIEIEEPMKQQHPTNTTMKNIPQTFETDDISQTLHRTEQTTSALRKTIYFNNADLDMESTKQPSSTVASSKEKTNDDIGLNLPNKIESKTTHTNLLSKKARQTILYNNSDIDIEKSESAALSKHEKTYQRINKRQTIIEPIDIETDETDCKNIVSTKNHSKTVVNESMSNVLPNKLMHTKSVILGQNEKSLHDRLDISTEASPEQSAVKYHSKVARKTNFTNSIMQEDKTTEQLRKVDDNETEETMKQQHPSNITMKNIPSTVETARQTMLYNNSDLDIEKSESAALAQHEKTYQRISKRQTIIEPIDIETDETDCKNIVSTKNLSKTVVNESMSNVLPNKLMHTKSVILGQNEKSLHDRLDISTEVSPEQSAVKYHSKVARKTIFTNSIMQEDKSTEQLRKVDETRKTILCSSEEMDISTIREDSKELQTTSSKVVEQCTTSGSKNMTNAKLSPNKKHKSPRISLYKKVLTRKTKDRKTILYNNQGVDESIIYEEPPVTKTVENAELLEQRQSQKKQKEIDTSYSVNSCMGQDIDIENGNNYENIQKKRSTMADGKRKTTYETINMQVDEQSNDFQQNSMCHQSFNSNKKYKSDKSRIDESVNLPNVIANADNRKTILFGDARIEEDTTIIKRGEKSYRAPLSTKNKRQTTFEPINMDIDRETQSNLDHSISNPKTNASSFNMDQSKPELRAEPIDDTGTNPYILQVTPRNLQRTISFRASPCHSTPDLSRKGSRIINQDKREMYTPRRNLYETTADYFEAAELECFEELEDIAKDRSIAQDIAKDCFNRSTKSGQKSNKKPVFYNKTITETEEVNNRVPKALLKDLRPSFKLSTENLHHALQHETETNEKQIGSSFVGFNKHSTAAGISDPSGSRIAANTSESEEINKTKSTHQGTLHFAHGNEDEMEISICGINNEIKLNNNGNNLTIKSENNNRNVKQTILFTKDNLEISFDGDPHCDDNDKAKENLLHTEEDEMPCTEIGSPLNMTNFSDSYTKKQSPRKVMFSKLKNLCHPKRCIIFGDDMNTSINASSTSNSLQYSPVPENALQEQLQVDMDISNRTKELSFDPAPDPNILDIDEIESNPESHTPILFKKIPRNSVFLINKNRNKSSISTPDTTEALGNLDIDNITHSSYKRSEEHTEPIHDNGFNNYPELLSQPDIENTRSNLIDSISYEDETHISVESTSSICIIDRRSQNDEENEAVQPSNIDLGTNVENLPTDTCKNAINTSAQADESLKPEPDLCKKCRNCGANRSSLSSIPLKSDICRQKREINWSGYERYKNLATFSDVFADQKKRRESMSLQYSTMENSFEESVVQPLVPSIEFLLENYAKQKRKELCDEQFQDDDFGPVFPTDRPFIYLLRNKLESNCDWRLDDLLALNGILSFYHKSHKSFYLTLKYSPLALRTNSDIEFESVTLKDNPIYKKLTTFDTIIKSEMLFKVPRDLKYLCWSSLDIFKLLDFVNYHYQNAFNAGKQLHKSVILCGASIETDFRECTYVKKSIKVTTESGVEVKDFKLKIYKIDKISYNDINTPGLSNFKETIKNLPTGLDFLPSFFKNPIQFLK